MRPVTVFQPINVSVFQEVVYEELGGLFEWKIA